MAANTKLDPLDRKGADIRWFHMQCVREKIQPQEGDGSAFAERVAIKLETFEYPKQEKIEETRKESFNEYRNYKSR